VDALVALSGRSQEQVLAQLALPPSVAATDALAFSNTSMLAEPTTVEPVPPRALPELPATVLASQPNVMAADREAAAAWADIAVARANRWPRIDLAAVLTGQWLSAAGMTMNFITQSLGPEISATLFDGGRGAAQVGAAQARYRAAVATLQDALRTAAREVEDALAAQQAATTRFKMAHDTARAAQTSWRAASAQWRSGTISRIEFEAARRQFSSAQNSVASAARDRAKAWVALVSATGNSLLNQEEHGTNRKR
jgi:outer membrane protein TolC